MSNWKDRKAKAASLGTCPYHITNKIVDGKCLLCMAAAMKRKERALASNVCPNHPRITLTADGCPLCKQNYEKRRDLLTSQHKCVKHSVEFVGDICPSCDDIKIAAKNSGMCRRHPSTMLVENGCVKCHAEEQDRNTIRASLKEQRICLQHPSQYKPCQLCKEKYAEKRRIAILSNECFAHPGVPAVTGLMCFDCWCKSIAADALGSKKHTEIIKRSFTDSPYCAFTNKLLMPGHKHDSASFDHIIPVSRGGLKDIKNGQWVQLLLNVSKNNRTNSEYFAELEQIIRMRSLRFSPTFSLAEHHRYANSTFSQCSRCPSIKNPAHPSIASYCEKHYFQAVALKHFNTISLGPELRELFLQQGGLCYFSRTPLTLGSLDENAKGSLDHLIPISRGGLNDLPNVRWVSKRINTLKQTMTEEELISFASDMTKKFCN